MLTPQPDASIAADLPSVDHADIPASVPSTPALTVPSFNPIENVPALPQPAPAQPPVLPQTYRKFGDVAKTRQLIFDNVLKAASTLPPMTNTRHAMHIENVRWSGPETYSIADQKQAILSRGTLGRKLIGEVVLRNPDGSEIERRNTQLARVPYMTDRGTFIVNGNEYTMSHQMRLRPGVFTRMKQNGELESHVNVAKGYSHRIELDPATGVFKVNIGQAHIQLMPLLRAMGVPETKIRESWGNELTSANMQKEDTQAMRKLHEKLFRGKPAGEEGVNQSVVKAFNDMVLDPDVTKRTLGQGFSNVGPDTLLAITSKLLRVAKQEDEPDDRDAMAYQTLVGPEDVLAERIQKSKNILRKLFWKASGRGNLQNVASNSLDEAIRAGLLTSGLGQPLSEINPAEIFDQHSRVTRMGEGGITSMDAVPDEARAVQPSQFGFIDYLRTPESGKVGVDARIANATVKGDNGQIYTKVRMRDGAEAYKTPQDFADATVAFPNEMTSPDGYVAALQKGRFTMVPRDAVDFEVPNNEDVFSPLGNMIPFKSALKGQRAVMAARMMTQALPLRNAEAPHVQSGIAGEKGVSYEDRYAKHMGAVHAEQPARIIDVNDNGITMVNADGEKKTIQLYHNFPFNQKTYVHQTPMVGVGDIVKPGQLLAKSNFTDDKGTTALGLNARVAYIPWGGLNFEDANVVSESFAKRMSSEHMYQHDHEWESNDKKGLNSFRSIFPAEYDRKTLSQFDEHGVIKPGTPVKQGDPLILIARAKELNKKSLLRGTKPIYQNMSQLWENSDEGVVTDVVHTPKGAAVVVKATVPMQVGDKMCFDEDTEVLTKRGWVYIADVLMTDEICTLQHGDEINYLYPTALHRYATGGRMYKIQSQQVDQFVTVNHRQYVRKRNQDTFTLERAENVYGKRVCYKKNGNWQGVSPTTVTIDGFDVRAGRSGNGKRRLPDVTLSVETYLTLLGAFISEGNLVNQPKSGTYGIDITQIKQPNRSQIMDELSRLDVHFNEHNHNEKIRVHSKVLYNHFAQFGRTAKEKHLPAEIFNWAKADLQILFRWLMWGDGTVNHVDRPICYTTTSPQLADDVQRLCLHIGYAANVIKDHDGGTQTIKGTQYYCQPRYSVRVVTTKLTPMVNHGHTKTQCVQEECIIENYDRPVYCVTVPGHVLYVRRNGKPCWSGNSGRFGDKGIVSYIIPDDQMMTDKDGKPFEVLLNPLGITSRTNPAQIIEAALGKVAAMRGEAYKVPDFQDEDDMVEFALGELRKHGLDDSEQLTDPRTNRKIPDVFTGSRWIMKLHHTAESKGQGRGLGAYTAEGTPAKGGAEGAKRIGMLETNALLSHGATQFLRNSSLIRGQSNPQLWAQYMSGNKMPTVAVPHVYHKYVNNLRSAGINVVREGTRLNVMALTDKDIDQLAADREIKNAETVDWKTMEPVRGGLFDTTLTGGHATSEGGGNRWSYIKLHEPLPNPVMEEPIRRVLGLTTNKFNDILSGKERLNDKTGPTAIAEALGNINVDSELARARADIASNKKTARDAAIRRLNFLKSAQRLGIHPKDWMLSRVPVLPPAFRPVSTMGANKLPLVADANYLYKELFDANSGLKEIAKQLDPDDLGDERMAVYNAFKAVTGLGDPTHAKNQERGVKGILKHVFGSSPKLGAVQRRLLGSSTDLVGRAVIAPDPDLDMDQVGLPENQAWTIYRPVLIHKLVRKGMPRLQAARAVEERSQAARTALLDEMDNGVVVINRAPTLHRYGMMAARPRLVKGDVLKISPLVVGGFGADFDGDAMQYHVPVGDEEKQEVMEKMLPSRNLFSAATFKTHFLPSQEYVGGLYAATTNVDTKNHPLVFDTAADAIRAYRSGQIGSDRQVHILNQ